MTTGRHHFLAKRLPLVPRVAFAPFALAFTLLICVASAAPAQTPQQPETQPQSPAPAPAQDATNARAAQARQRLEEMQQRLQLTPEQVEQVRPILVEEMQQFKELRGRSSGSADQNRRARLKMGRELRDIQKSTDKKLEKVLSKPQMDELKKLREEWRQQLRERAAER